MSLRSRVFSYSPDCTHRTCIHICRGAGAPPEPHEHRAKRSYQLPDALPRERQLGGNCQACGSTFLISPNATFPHRATVHPRNPRVSLAFFASRYQKNTYRPPPPIREHVTPWIDNDANKSVNRVLCIVNKWKVISCLDRKKSVKSWWIRRSCVERISLLLLFPSTSFGGLITRAKLPGHAPHHGYQALYSG